MELRDIPLSLLNKAVELKRKWSSLYCLKVGEMCFLVRLLTKGEFIFFLGIRQYMLGVDDDFVFNNCVLYPELKTDELDNLKAGIIPSVVEAVIELSGFSSPEMVQELIKENRSFMELADNQIVATLCKAFPQLDPEKIDNFDIQKIAHYLALAEQILGVSLEFKIEQDKQNTNKLPVDFTADNRKLKDQGFFGNSDPRKKEVKPSKKPKP